MKKVGRRFIAWLVVFASIISFLPIKILNNGQVVNAATNLSEAREIEVSSPEAVDSSKKPTYSTQNQVDYFNITVKNMINTTNWQVNETRITDQEVIITSINRIRLYEYNGQKVNDYDEVIETLKSLNGIEIGTTQPDNGRLGAQIINLPLGINEITYRVRVKEETKVYAHPEDPEDKTTKIEVNETNPDEKTIKIEHGNSFVQSQIKQIDFIDYVGGRPTNTDNEKNNKTPIQYYETVYSKEGESLKFKHEVPNSVTDLDYSVFFPFNVNTTANNPNNDIVVVNGLEQKNVTATGNTLNGSLVKTGSTTLIMIAIRHKSEDSDKGAIQNTYAIEIEYNNKKYDNDYSIKEAGITKYNYKDDSNVDAYIGKKFVVDYGKGDLENVPIYSGVLYIDKLADMVSMEPTLGRPSSKTAFKIYNYYDGGVEPGQLKNGKTYVDFHKGTTNTIYLEVYEGKDGSVTGTTPLAIYKFEVKLLNEKQSSEVEFEFKNGEILTQPGRPVEEQIQFKSTRRTYDLHSENDKVKVELTKPNTLNNDVVPAERREYIKAWLGNSVKSDNVKLYEFKENENADKANVSIEVLNAKKLVLQACYDEIVYEKDADGNIKVDEEGNNKIKSITSYAIGDKYTFYIAKNAEKDDNNGESSEGSSNPSLSNIQVKGTTIKASDGSTGFSNDRNVYEATVPKADESARVTVTTEESKVKDITVTVTETGDEYGLESGEPFNFPLTSSGKTTLEIVVTAQDGINSKMYTLIINNDSRSASALLKNVITDNGDFTFDPDKRTNKIRVDQGTKKISITPIPEESNAKVTVDGKKYNGSPIIISLAGSQQTDIDIIVTSEDGSESKTYSFEIIRTDSALDDDNDDDEDDVFYDEIDDCWVDTSKYEEWGTIKGKPVYFDKKGRQVKDSWICTNESWYYLNSKGYRSTGWRKDTVNKTYYLDPTSGEMRKGWMNQNGKWYYLGLNGVMHKGWLYLNNNWYYFTQEGEMIVNQSMFVDDKIYRFGLDGAIY